MGEVVRFPVERVPGYFDPETYCATPAMILILPVIRIDRDEPEGPAPGRRRRRRSDPTVRGLLSPEPEARVRGAFNALHEAFSLVETPHGTADLMGFMIGDSGDETD